MRYKGRPPLFSPRRFLRRTPCDGVRGSNNTSPSCYFDPAMNSRELLGAVLDRPSNERARFARELLAGLDESDSDASDEQELVAETR